MKPEPVLFGKYICWTKKNPSHLGFSTFHVNVICWVNIPKCFFGLATDSFWCILAWWFECYSVTCQMGPQKVESKHSCSVLPPMAHSFLVLCFLMTVRMRPFLTRDSWNWQFMSWKRGKRNNEVAVRFKPCTSCSRLSPSPLDHLRSFCKVFFCFISLFQNSFLILLQIYADVEYFVSLL